MLSLSEKNTSYNIILYHFGDMFISGRMHYKGSTGANWVLLCRWPLGNIHEHAYLWFMEARTTTLKNIWLFQSRKVCVHWQSNSLQLLSCKRSPVMRQTPCQLCILSTLRLDNPSDSGECENASCSPDLVQYILQVRVRTSIHHCSTHTQRETWSGIKADPAVNHENQTWCS